MAPPHRRRRVHQPAVGRDMGNGNELDPLVDHVLKSLDGDLAELVVGDDINGSPGFPGDLEEGDIVAGILIHGCQNAISGF